MIYEVSNGKTTLRIGLREVGESVYELTVDGKTSRVDASKSGRMIYSVIEIGVREGEAVEMGATLLVVEPQA